MNAKEKNIAATVILGKLYTMDAPREVLDALKAWMNAMKEDDTVNKETIGVTDVAVMELVNTKEKN